MSNSENPYRLMPDPMETTLQFVNQRERGLWEALVDHFTVALIARGYVDAATIAAIMMADRVLEDRRDRTGSSCPSE